MPVPLSVMGYATFLKQPAIVSFIDPFLSGCVFCKPKGLPKAETKLESSQGHPFQKGATFQPPPRMPFLRPDIQQFQLTDCGVCGSFDSSKSGLKCRMAPMTAPKQGLATTRPEEPNKVDHLSFAERICAKQPWKNCFYENHHHPISTITFERFTYPSIS